MALQSGATNVFSARSGEGSIGRRTLSLVPEPASRLAKSAKKTGRPVFIVGSPRSGTTLLYDMLLSSGKFALYRAESDMFFRIAPAFGNLRSRSQRKKLIDAWLQSDYFVRTGLSGGGLRARLISECSNPGDFLRIVMDTIAQHQGLSRWAENTPFHVLYLAKIKKMIPDALFVHIIRDGRDVAISMDRLGWPGCFRWDSRHHLAVSALYWKWHVSQGRKAGRMLGCDYFEVRYEELVSHPEETLRALGYFMEEDLSYRCIRQNPVGTVARPNSSFPFPAALRTIGRWRDLPDSDLIRLNSLLAPLLQELGYEVAMAEQPTVSYTSRRLAKLYQAYWSIKHKVRESPVSRFLVSRERLERGALDRFDACFEDIRHGAGDSVPPRSLDALKAQDCFRVG